MTTPETEQSAPSLTLSDITFEEAELLEDALDMSIETLRDRLQSDKPKVKIIRALKWLEMRRTNPEATFADAAGLSIMEAFSAPADPKAKAEPNAKRTGTANTRRSASSTAT